MTGLMKTPQGRYKTSTVQYGITSGANFSGATALPVFETVVSNDDSGVVRNSSSRVTIPGARRVKLEASGIGDASRITKIRFYDKTKEVWIGTEGRVGSPEGSYPAKVNTTFDADTFVELRVVDNNYLSNQDVWSTTIEDKELYIVKTEEVKSGLSASDRAAMINEMRRIAIAM